MLFQRHCCCWTCLHFSSQVVSACWPHGAVRAGDAVTRSRSIRGASPPAAPFCRRSGALTAVPTHRQKAQRKRRIGHRIPIHSAQLLLTSCRTEVM